MTVSDFPADSAARPAPADLVVTQLLDLLPLAIIIADAEARVVYINAAYRRIFALADDVAVVGRPSADVFALILPAFVEPARLLAAAQNALLTRHGFVDLRLALVDGTVVQVDAAVLPDGGWLVTYRDVTAEERAKQELASIARIPAQNPNPIFRVGADGQALYRNPAAVALRASLAPEEIASAFGQVFALIGAALASGVPQQATLAGGGRVFDVHLVPFPAEQYVNLYLVETTARHAAEAETQRQRGFYEAILDHLPADVVVIDPDLRYRYLNPQAIRDPALRAWIIGRDDLEYFAYRGRPRAVAEQRQQVLRQALVSGQQVSWDEELAPRDGSGTRYLTRFVQPVFDEAGAPQVLIGYGLDITPIREAQLTQARSDKQYRDLMNYTQALICIHDLEGRLLSVNPAIARLLGVVPAKVVGRYLADLMPPRARADVAAYLAQFARQAEVTGVMPVQPRHEAGTRYLLYHNIRIEEAGEAPYVIGYAQDITERIRAERATLKAKEAAEESARARENFLANMSHEIRTPLNGVLGMAGLLAKTTVDAYQRELLDVIQRSGQHLLGIINDVLDMAKLSSEKLELIHEPFNVCDALSTALDPLMREAQAKGITVHGRRLRESCPYPWVLGDAQRLTQVMLNLVSNAVKFTPAGGSIWVNGDLVAETPETLTVAFSVRDTGIGVTPEQQAHIFQPFTQAYASISREFGGTGLGLSISRSLVEQMGGTLHLTSAPQQGSTFAFTLTLPRTHPQPTAPAVVPAVDPVAGLRVLVAEDNAVNRLLVRLLLTHHGAHITEATNGAEALALVQAQPFEVVLMDVQMPVMNGLDATAAIRALPDPARARVPILGLTANAFRSDTDRYLAAGMDGCLTKPFEEAELLRLLAELTAGRPAGPPADAFGAAPPAPAPPAPHEPPPPGAPFPATALWLGRGNPAFVVQLVDEFLANTPALLAQLDPAAPTAAAAAVADIAHQLLPSARTFDAPEAAAALAELETWPADDPQWPAVREYAAQEVATLLEELRQWRAAA